MGYLSPMSDETVQACETRGATCTLTQLLETGLARELMMDPSFHLTGWATLGLLRASGARDGINSPGLDLDLQLGSTLAVLHRMNYITAHRPLSISGLPCAACREQA